MAAIEATADIAHDLCRLTELLDSLGHEASQGILGGEWGYGAEWVSDVFEMHPYWWSGCECGHEETEWAWEQANPHTPNCYQSELARRDYQEPEKLAKEWRLPRVGCFVHCTCGRTERWQAWQVENPHPPACPEVRPNFWHKRSGLEIRWYKWIGRSMEFEGPVPTARDWANIFAECVADVQGGA